ncbi:MAG: hypothetical protein GF307_07080 [candidate division Zixibacteria bacterium]|nr:hypothetical protein [candidate division Zixibacteria bacterium]
MDMKKLFSVIIQIFIPLLWVFSMVLLAGQSDIGSERLQINDIFSQAPESLAGQSWAGIYLKDEKIGYGYQSYQQSDKGVIYKEYMLMRIPLGGSLREVIADNFALLDSSLSVKSFSAGMTSGEYDVTIHGLVDNGRLELTYLSGGKKNTKTIPIENNLYFQGQITRLVKRTGFKEGEFSAPVFDPLSMTIAELNVDVSSPVIEDADTVYNLGLDMNGIKTTMLVDSEGNLIKETQPGGMMLKGENRETALAMENIYSGDKDFLVTLSVPSSEVIINDRNVRYFKAELKGIEYESYRLDDGSTQRLVNTRPPIIEITRGNNIHRGAIDRDEYLQSTDFVQADDEQIVELARKLTAGLTANREKAFAIADWVYENIEKDITVSVPSAVEVLRVKRGDCNEHTALYTALARAAGLPTKVIVGIVYKDGIFYYHAWPAVFLGYWHQLDPTFGQHTADATHIQLLEGGIEKQTELVNVVGKLEVKVLDYN